MIKYQKMHKKNQISTKSMVIYHFYLNIQVVRLLENSTKSEKLKTVQNFIILKLLHHAKSLLWLKMKA